jgi:hypothetical protein
MLLDDREGTDVGASMLRSKFIWCSMVVVLVLLAVLPMVNVVFG